MTTEYALHIPPEIERKIRQLRAAVQTAIRLRLQEILEDAAASPAGRLLRPLGPPPRFYAEGFRVFYQVEPETRRVVVLDLRPAFA